MSDDTAIKTEQPGFFEIVWQFDKFIEKITENFGYIDIENDGLAKRALQLAPEYHKKMKSDKIFGHLMEYKNYDDTHVRKCSHCRIFHDAAQIAEQVRARRVTAWTAVADLDELWNGRRKRPGPLIEL